MDASAINEIASNAAARDLGQKVNDTDTPIVALPDTFTLHNLEKFHEQKTRFTGAYATSHVDSYVAYFEAMKAENPLPPVFVNPQRMAAHAIFNLGTVDMPGHGDNRACLQLEQTAAFAAFLQMTNSPWLPQKGFAEWLEDWREFITAVNGEGEQIEIRKLIATVRSITVEAKRTTENNEQDYNRNRSAIEQLEAKSQAGSLPKVITFRCSPYADLPVQDFRFRLPIHEDGDKVTFSANRIQPEQDDEVMAENFVTLLQQRLGEGANVFQGNFNT